MTERAEPMTPEVVADLLTGCINATIRRDREAVEAAMDRLFLQGTPEDGLRFIMGCLLLLTELLPSAQLTVLALAGSLVGDGATDPAETLLLRMLADVVCGDQDRAMGRWIDALLDEADGPAGVPGRMLGMALRQVAGLVGSQRARLQ